MIGDHSLLKVFQKTEKNLHQSCNVSHNILGESGNGRKPLLFTELEMKPEAAKSKANLF